jgi:hypothetical protein
VKKSLRYMSWVLSVLSSSIIFLIVALSFITLISSDFYDKCGLIGF